MIAREDVKRASLDWFIKENLSKSQAEIAVHTGLLAGIETEENAENLRQIILKGVDALRPSKIRAIRVLARYHYAWIPDTLRKAANLGDPRIREAAIIELLRRGDARPPARPEAYSPPLPIPGFRYPILWKQVQPYHNKAAN